MDRRGVFNFLWVVLIVVILGVGVASLNYYKGSVQMAPDPNYNCADTDGGKFADIAGTTSGVFAGTNFSYKDGCANGKVSEYYCTTNNKRQPISPPPVVSTCANGCSVNANGEGYCNPTPVKCTDSDGGQVFDIVGSTSGLDWGTTNVVSKTDYCITRGEKAGKLAEYYCMENQVASISYSCPNGCANGACIQAPSVEFVTLQRAIIIGDNINVVYSKNFVNCVHMLDTTGGIVHTNNWFCDSGTDISKTAPLSDFRIKSGDSVKLCNGNDYGICSDYITITSATLAVTYQGVLDMLSRCVVIAKSMTSPYNGMGSDCNIVCKNNAKTCVDAEIFDLTRTDQLFERVECVQPLNPALVDYKCVCCSP